MIPNWFLYLGGFSLCILGILQLVHRPRRPGAGALEHWLGLGTAWSLVCIAVGLGLLLMALGYWQGPFGMHSPAPPNKVPRYH
jgi:hypothetical protein